jgi:hypothetical protein
MMKELSPEKKISLTSSIVADALKEDFNSENEAQSASSKMIA